MKTTDTYRLLLVTVPDRKTAQKLAHAALEARLIACANLIPGIESIYRWEGKVESGREILMLLKSSRSKLKALEHLLLEKHPYDTPEIVVVPIEAVTKKYLDWMGASLEAPP